VGNTELVNQYLDLSKETLEKIKFDDSIDDNNLRLLFCISFEKSLDAFANEIFIQQNLDINNFMEMNAFSKLNKISNHKNSLSVISKQLEPNGLIETFEDIYKKEINPPSIDLITSSNKNTLKKLNLLLNKYGEWISSYRKFHHEC